MTAENKIPENDQLFDDNFDFLEGASLAELYLEGLHRISERHNDGSVTRPYPIWRVPENRGEMLVDEYGITIRPQAYHRAIDLDKAKPDQIVETAHNHYEQLRQLGMPVVGHMFEPISKRSRDFEIDRRYPTILAAAKLLSDERVSDQPENPVEGERQYIGAERLIDADGIGRLGLTAEEYEEKLIGPVRAYLKWCEESGQTYMHSDVVDIDAYMYQERQRVLGLRRPSTLMQRTTYEGDFMVPVGSLYMAAQEFGDFTKKLTGKEEKLEMPL